MCARKQWCVCVCGKCWNNAMTLNWPLSQSHRLALRVISAIIAKQARRMCAARARIWDECYMHLYLVTQCCDRQQWQLVGVNEALKHVLQQNSRINWCVSIINWSVCDTNATVCFTYGARIHVIRHVLFSLLKQSKWQVIQRCPNCENAPDLLRISRYLWESSHLAYFGIQELETFRSISSQKVLGQQSCVMSIACVDAKPTFGLPDGIA